MGLIRKFKINDYVDQIDKLKIRKGEHNAHLYLVRVLTFMMVASHQRGRAMQESI